MTITTSQVDVEVRFLAARQQLIIDDSHEVMNPVDRIKTNSMTPLLNAYQNGYTSRPISTRNHCT